MIKAIVTGIGIRFEENQFTGNYDCVESIIVNGKIFETRRVATRHHANTFGVEATFDLLVEEGARSMKRMLREEQTL